MAFPPLSLICTFLSWIYTFPAGCDLLIFLEGNSLPWASESNDRSLRPLRGDPARVE
jgi:hypothetical protein